MRSIYNFIIYSDQRYNNSTNVEGKELVLNTEITERDYMFTNRIGRVISTPLMVETPIQKDDEVILHHNVFRRWIDIHGNEKNSSSLLSDTQYIVSPEQIYAYKRNDKWECLNEYCFVAPLDNKSKWATETEQKLLGELVYSNRRLDALGFTVGDVVGFTPDSEYEFNIDGKKLYRILSNQITIQYGSTKESN